jgi:membrane protein implicated in regulation of membrane protease activity
MNRALLIIGIPAIGVAAFYSAALWGWWVAMWVAIGLSVLLAGVAVFDRRRRQAGRAQPAGRG